KCEYMLRARDSGVHSSKTMTVTDIDNSYSMRVDRREDNAFEVRMRVCLWNTSGHAARLVPSRRLLAPNPGCRPGGHADVMACHSDRGSSMRTRTCGCFFAERDAIISATRVPTRSPAEIGYAATARCPSSS